MQEKPSLRELITVHSPSGTVNLISLALPLFLENLFNHTLGTVNTAVLGNHSQSSVAAVGTVSTVINFLTLAFSAVATGVSVALSNAIGAGNDEKRKRSAFAALILSLFLSLLISLSVVFAAPWIVTAMNLTDEAYLQGLSYLCIRAAFFFLPALSSCMLALLRCYGKTGVAVVAGLLSNTVNAALNVAVVALGEHLPCSVVSGIAAGAVLSQLVGLICVSIAFLHCRIPTERIRQWRELGEYWLKFLKIGLPAALSSASYSVSLIITNSFVALLGTQIVAAKVIFNSILSYSYLFSISVGTANSLLTGRLCGAGHFRHASLLNRALIRITMPVNLGISLLILLFRVPLLRLYAPDPAVAELSFAILLIDLIPEQARAISQVYEYALRAAGDVVIGMIVLIASCWLFGVGLSYVLAIPCGLGLAGCWIGLALDESTRALYSCLRWRQGKWRTLSQR